MRPISFVRELQDVADALVTAPLRFPFLDARHTPDVHRRNHRGDRIIDRVRPAEVLILHVHHGRRGTPSL